MYHVIDNSDNDEGVKLKRFKRFYNDCGSRTGNTTSNTCLEIASQVFGVIVLLTVCIAREIRMKYSIKDKYFFATGRKLCDAIQISDNLDTPRNLKVVYNAKYNKSKKNWMTYLHAK